MNIIDSHVHLFALELGQYNWLKPDNPPFWPDKQLINKSFNESSLRLNAPFSLAGFVHIEAGFDNEQPWREINYLESHCHLPFRSVAAIDLTLSSDAFAEQVNHLLTYRTVVGVRHILDEQACQLLSHNNTLNNLKTLECANLSFDLQMDLADVRAVELVQSIYRQLPNLTLIINHMGWPPLTVDKQALQKSNWHKGLLTLSKHSLCAIKCSGWEMLNRDYQRDEVLNSIRHVIDVFGEDRVMLAGNFPLCLFSTSYQELWQTYRDILDPLDITKLCLTNTQHWYRF